MSAFYSTISRFTTVLVPGATIQLPNADEDIIVILAPTTDFNGLTITWPTNPQNGQLVSILSTGNITGIVNGGTTLNQNFTSIAATGSIVYTWDTGGNTWMVTEIQVAKGNSNVAFSGTTNASGNVVFYPTVDGTSTGNPLFASIKYIHRDFSVANPNQAMGAPVASSGNRIITTPVVQQTFTGIQVVGINVLGSNTVAAAAAGVSVNFLITGTLN